MWFLSIVDHTSVWIIGVERCKFSQGGSYV